MNKNDYINDLNKIKTTDSMKKRLMDAKQGKEGDDFMMNKNYTRIIGLVASIALFLTIGSVVFTLGMGKGNNGSNTQVVGESVKDTTKETAMEIDTETTINHDEEPTGETMSDEEIEKLNKLMYFYDVSRDIEISLNISENVNSIIVTIKNKSKYLDYDFGNKIIFSHLEGNNHVFTGTRQCVNDNINTFTVKKESSKDILIMRKDISDEKELEDYIGSNEFGINFVCYHTADTESSYMIEEPVRVTFTAGEDNSTFAENISIATILDGDENFSTSLVNSSVRDIIYADNRRLLEYDNQYDVFYEVPKTHDTTNKTERVLTPGENIWINSNLINLYLDYEFKNTKYCMTNHLKTKEGKIMYIEYFKMGIEQGQTVLIPTNNENDLVLKQVSPAEEKSGSFYDIKVEILNMSDYVYSTGEKYTIYNYNAKSKEYVELPMKDNVGWEDVAYEIDANSEYVTTIKLDKLYDIKSLPNGIYKVKKEFNNIEMVVARFVMRNGSLVLYDNSNADNILCKESLSAITSGDLMYHITARFINISDSSYNTGNDFYIYRFNEDTCEYEVLEWREDATATAIEHIIEPNSEYETKFHLDSLYDVLYFEDGLYKITKRFNGLEVTVGEFIKKNGVYDSCD